MLFRYEVLTSNSTWVSLMNKCWHRVKYWMTKWEKVSSSILCVYFLNVFYWHGLGTEMYEHMYCDMNDVKIMTGKHGQNAFTVRASMYLYRCSVSTWRALCGECTHNATSAVTGVVSTSCHWPIMQQRLNTTVSPQCPDRQHKSSWDLHLCFCLNTTHWCGPQCDHVKPF